MVCGGGASEVPLAPPLSLFANEIPWHFDMPGDFVCQGDLFEFSACSLERGNKQNIRRWVPCLFFGG